MTTRKTHPELLANKEKLLRRLAATEEAMRAIGSGAADTLAVFGSEDEQLCPLKPESPTHREVDLDLLTRILDSLPTNTAVIDDQGTIVSVNESWVRFAVEHGAPHACGGTFVGVNYLEVCRGSALEGDHLAREALDGIETVLSGQWETFTLEYPCHSATARLWFLMTVVRYHGSTPGAVITHFAISERKLAEERLLAGAARYRLLADTMLQGVVHQDVAGTIIAMNPAAEEILGKSREEFLGSSSVQVEHHTLREDGTPFPGLEHPSMVALRTRSPVRNVIMGVFNPRRDEYRWINIDAVPFFLDDESQSLEVYTVFTDITEKRETEETLRRTLAELEQRVASRTEELARSVAALRVSEERYRTVVEDQTELISRSRPDGAYTFVNEVFCRFFGHNQSELLGASWAPQPVAEDIPFIEAELQRLSPTTPVVIIENRVYDAVGAIRWMQFVNRGFFDEQGRLLETQAVGRDITARKQAEMLMANLNDQLEEQVAERTNELTMINTSLTHEMKERLRIEQEILEHQQRLQEMSQELALTEDRERDRIAAELHDQVNQRLVLAKMKVEAMARKLAAPALEKTAVGICDLLAQTIEDTRSLTAQIRPPILANSGLEAAVRWLGDELHEQYGLWIEVCDDHEPKALEYGVRSCVFQAVRELLMNVVKHAGVSQARVVMRREGRHLVIIVADDGSGFDPAEANTRKARAGGFGLFTVSQKIEYLGGFFRIDSQPGAGARATIKMPLTAAEAGGEAAGKLKILLVDDQSFVREGLRALIAGEPDLEVVAEAGDGRAAVALARDQRPDVVIMDLNMIDMSGIDATRAITTELAGVRVVAFSVESDRRFIIDALSAGAGGYVRKDSPFAVLAAAIRAVAAGETYLGPRISDIVIRDYLQRVPDGESLFAESLTVREREVLQLIAAGKTVKEIAFALEINAKTVDGLRRKIMDKLNLHSTAELTKYAIREGLTSLK